MEYQSQRQVTHTLFSDLSFLALTVRGQSPFCGLALRGNGITYAKVWPTPEQLGLVRKLCLWDTVNGGRDIEWFYTDIIIIAQLGRGSSLGSDPTGV